MSASLNVRESALAMLVRSVSIQPFFCIREYLRLFVGQDELHDVSFLVGVDETSVWVDTTGLVVSSTLFSRQGERGQRCGPFFARWCWSPGAQGSRSRAVPASRNR